MRPRRDREQVCQGDGRWAGREPPFGVLSWRSDVGRPNIAATHDVLPLTLLSRFIG